MPLRNLQDLYVDELKELYNAEQQNLKALPKMAKAASSAELKNAFNEHFEQTREQVRRLDRIFQELGKAPRGRQCAGMQGIIEEGTDRLKEKAAPSIKDAGLISAAQRVEHYEMAGYGTVRTFAQLLGFDDQAQALQQTLNEEGATDRKLTQLAERLINPKAGHIDQGVLSMSGNTMGRGSSSRGRAHKGKTGRSNNEEGLSHEEEGSEEET